MSRLQVIGGLHATPERPDFEEAAAAHRSTVSPLRPAVAPKRAALPRQDADYFGPDYLELEPALSAPHLLLRHGGERCAELRHLIRRMYFRSPNIDRLVRVWRSPTCVPIGGCLPANTGGSDRRRFAGSRRRHHRFHRGTKRPVAMGGIRARLWRCGQHFRELETQLHS